ncbi:hypothetical protein DFH07DRAFT_750018, partial [Mycena maculata]
LRIDNPICALVRCEGNLFLAVGAVNNLCLGSETVNELSLDFLANTSATVSFQIMCLVRTPVEDDLSQQYDWKWSQKMDGTCMNVSGRLIHPLNPTLSVRNPGKPTYLFESSELLAYGATLLEQILPEDIRANHGQRVLEHCAAHILHNEPALSHKSTCLYKIRFQYAVAAQLIPGSPCSNVPVICIQCGPKKPAIWRYNLGAHFQKSHCLSDPRTWPMDVKIEDAEVDGLKVIWNERQKYTRPRQTRVPKNPLAISEQHSSRLAFR